MKSRERVVVAASSVLVVFVLSAAAEVSTLSASALFRGLLHPLTGLDHVLAMTSVGLWASQKGGRGAYMLPLTFVVAMAGGGALGMTGVAFPMVEPMIAASVLVLGLVIASARTLPLPAGMGIVVLFALFHGNAHGLEAPMLGRELYIAGFVASTLGLHGLGAILGAALDGALGGGRGKAIVRVGGVLSAALGAALFFL